MQSQIIASKEELYKELALSIRGLIDGEVNLVANLANITALLKERLGHFWIGFYLVDDAEKQLVLGPFQGPLACTRIPFGRGVCGVCWKQKASQVVPNVHEFPGHIACSTKTNSEIVVPVINEQRVVAVLDIDSIELETFDEQDKAGLEHICGVISKLNW
jgi:L-methionine (R)-S-oxide reductase